MTEYYTFRVTETEGGAYRATEPGSENETYGWGQSQAQAIARYCELMRGGSDE